MPPFAPGYIAQRAARRDLTPYTRRRPPVSASPQVDYDAPAPRVRAARPPPPDDSDDDSDATVSEDDDSDATVSEDEDITDTDTNEARSFKSKARGKKKRSRSKSVATSRSGHKKRRVVRKHTSTVRRRRPAAHRTRRTVAKRRPAARRRPRTSRTRRACTSGSLCTLRRKSRPAGHATYEVRGGKLHVHAVVTISSARAAHLRARKAKGRIAYVKSNGDVVVKVECPLRGR